MPVEDMLVVAVVTLVVFNSWATITVIRSDMFEPLQKAMQIALVWFVPLFGAIMVFGIARRPEPERFEMDLATHYGPETFTGGENLTDHTGVDGH